VPSDFDGTVAAYRAAEQMLANGRARAIGVSHIERGVSAIPKSVKPHRIAENIDTFDFALAPDEVTAIDALDACVRGGPDPELVDTKLYPFKLEN
jgi:diketogulonate reductase-like aldo/keto reductase